MAWTSPRTWTVGETLTAANMNTHVRDNLNWLANDRPRCRANMTGSQNITDSTQTAVQFGGIDSFDVGAMHDPASNNTRLTVPSGGGGVYMFGVDNIGWQANNNGVRDLGLRVNGLTTVAFQRVPATQNTNTFPPSMVSFYALAATDYVEAMVTQTSGGTISVSTASLWACWIAF